MEKQFLGILFPPLDPLLEINMKYDNQQKTDKEAKFGLLFSEHLTCFMFQSYSSFEYMNL